MADTEMGKKGDEPKAGRKLWMQDHWFLLIPILTAMVAVFSAIGFWEYELDKITSLKTQVRHLTAELSPFRVYAIKEYGGDEKQALAQLAEELKGLEKLKGIFRPLDEPARKRAVAAFRTVQTRYGTNQIHIELIAESSNTNRNMIIDEWVSILREAGFDAFVGRPEVSTLSNQPAALQIGYSASEAALVWSFIYADNFVSPDSLWSTNNA